MDLFENIKKISRKLDEEELLCQMAEECVELVKAMEELSSKHVVYNRDGSYLDGVEEEIADILLVSDVLICKMSCEDVALDFFAKTTFFAEEMLQKVEIGNMKSEVMLITLDVAKMSLKLRRAITMKNPTPISKRTAWFDLLYSLAVQNGMLHSLIKHYRFKNTIEIQERKAKRWIGRLTGGEANEQE